MEKNGAKGKILRVKAKKAEFKLNIDIFLQILYNHKKQKNGLRWEQTVLVTAICICSRFKAVLKGAKQPHSY